MSHFKERAQKSCLNCNAVVHGRFCHLCGQENIEPKETVWHLINHFFQDITHFDGKFFSTIKYLLFRPGHLSREYMMGRRASHLNPIRMYVFTSAFFFLFFFSTMKVDMSRGSKVYQKTQELNKTKAAIADLQSNVGTAVNDSLKQQAARRVLQRFEARVGLLEANVADIKLKDSLKLQKIVAKQDSMAKALEALGVAPKKKIGQGGAFSFSLEDLTGFSTLEAYDSVQAELPSSARDGWWQRLWARKSIDISEKASDKSGNLNNAIMSKFLHSLPQMFFLSLPLYAFFLMILYSREKKYYYVNHAIFSIHVFCATFIMSFIAILLAKYATFGSMVMNIIYNLGFMLAALLYQYKALRNFYQQRRAKTIVKFIILSVVSFLSVMMLAIIFLIISLWNI